VRSWNFIRLILTYQDAALEGRIERLAMVMKAARAGGGQISGLTSLARQEKSDLIELSAIGVLGMRV
jgi:hypothetical protein